MKNVALGFGLLLAVSGCASDLQSNDDLRQATAYQMGVPATTLTISNRQDSATSSNYWVRTASGATYSCVRSATISILGAVKSSPLCNPTNGRARSASGSSGNALLDAYRSQ